MSVDKLDYSYSVVIPLYRSEPTIRDVVDEVVSEFERLGIERYEIILVNDCSPDNVLSVAISLVEENKRITAIDLAHNAGQGRAILAGLKEASGDYIILMDDDMQHPGYEIGTLIDAIIERDDDVVFAKFDESGNKRTPVRRLGTRAHWWLSERFAGKPKDIQSNSFRIMKRFVRDALVNTEGHRMSSYGLIYHCTNHISNVTIEHRPRAVGKSGFTFMRLLDSLAASVLSFSSFPLRMSAIVGALLMVASLIGMLVAVFIHRFYIGLFWGFAFLTSIQLLALGLLGEYINRIFEVSMGSPRYTVRSIYRHGERPTDGEDLRYDKPPTSLEHFV